LDLIELLELAILVLVSTELIELAYHLYKMKGYCSRIDQHIDKMGSHMNKMDSPSTTQPMAPTTKTEERTASIRPR
jgi:hypothetical protein